jgi:hypothetical protein
MTWVDAVLSEEVKGAGGIFPPKMVLGGFSLASTINQTFKVRFCRPFELDALRTGSVDEGGIAGSMVEALRRVQLNPEMDLVGVRPYQKSRIERAILRRAGDQIEVFSVAGKGVDERGVLQPGEQMGLLLPVQRSVLEFGLVRAEQVNAQVLDRLCTAQEDGCQAWGFARVTVDETSLTGTRRSFEVTITPPIVEELEGRPNEFILCDGTHRVIAKLLLGDDEVGESPRMLQAVAVRDVSHPYYALPMSSDQWREVARRRLQEPPVTSDKYEVRAVPSDQQSHPALRKHKKSDWYRRYFRLLTLGFGYMGQQGGVR